ncbi:response regulator transcription factor [Stenotrophomonas sp. B1-1]|uniref:response regulator n=1 Tax=Stenotrophomonas sp. B1-1 TaxID=2710648 RepID=UPI0013DB220A|nr:response regulator transcription factor [Stenotrophomonas sp. B1-1]
MQNMMQATTIALVDDHPLALHGLKLVLAKVAGTRIVGAFEHPRGLLALLRTTPIDVVILDYALGVTEPPTVELIRKIHLEYPARIVVYSAMQGTFIQRACLDQGAFRFVQKRQSLEDLVGAVRACMEAGRRFIG